MHSGMYIFSMQICTYSFEHVIGHGAMGMRTTCLLLPWTTNASSGSIADIDTGKCHLLRQRIGMQQ